MSRFIFIHDFYRDGYHDMLSEVRVLQACGQWTKHKRASLTKQEVSSYLHLKHTYPRMDVSYWADRLAAIKSHRTAHFSPKPTVSHADMIRPLSPNTEAFCGLFDCGSDAVWGVCLYQDTKPALLLCDVCRQEWVRMHSAYTASDGWDWHSRERELLPLPVPRGDRLVVKPVSIFAPSAAIPGQGYPALAPQV